MNSFRVTLISVLISVVISSAVTAIMMRESLAQFTKGMTTVLDPIVNK